MATSLTSLTALTTLNDLDATYIVDVSDTTDNAAGSSRKLTLLSLYDNYLAAKITTAALWTDLSGTLITTDKDAPVTINSLSGSGGIFTIKGVAVTELLTSDPANDRIGIGTASPTDRLEIVYTNNNAFTKTTTNPAPYVNTGSTLDDAFSGFRITNDGGTENQSTSLILSSTHGDGTLGLIYIRHIQDNMNSMGFAVETGANGHEMGIQEAMMIEPLIDADLGRVRVKFHDLIHLNPTSRPTSPEEGDVIYNEDDNKLNFYNGSDWEEINSA